MADTDRLILVACTPDMENVLELTKPSIQRYADKCNAQLVCLMGDGGGRWQHGKFRVFEAGEYDFTGFNRVLIMDADVSPKETAPDIFAQYPSGNYMLNELNVVNHMVRLHQDEMLEHLTACGVDVSKFTWPQGVWWNPGVSLLEPDAIRRIFEMPPYNVNERRFHVGASLVVKNMPWINYRIAVSGVQLQSLHPAWNTFSTAPAVKVDRCYFIHYVCAQAPENRNKIKEQMIRKKESGVRVVRPSRLAAPSKPCVHAVMGGDQHRWILGRMWQAIVDTAPAGVQTTSSCTPIDAPGVVNYYNPYRGYTKKSRHARDVVFCTHPGLERTWNRASQEADHVVTMCDKYRQELVAAGIPARKVTTIHPGADASFRDTRLRVWNPSRMHLNESYKTRKGGDLWDELSKEPWINAVCSEGGISADRVYLEYLGADVVLSTAILEGGPMSLVEAVQLGKPCVMPRGVGLVDDVESPLIVRYAPGDYSGVMRILHEFYEEKQMRIRSLLDWTWERWGETHWQIFRQQGVPA